MRLGAHALAGVLLAVQPAAAAAGEGPAIHRGDAKAYRFLRETGRLPKLDAGGVERTLALVGWQPMPRRTDDPALAEAGPRLQILDAPAMPISW